MHRRKLRSSIDAPGHAHFLTFSTYQRQELLSYRHCGRIFLHHLDRARQRLDFQIWAYVVMPDHAHLLIKPTLELYAMAKILKAMKADAAKEILATYPELRNRCLVNSSNGQVAHRFWQAGGGYDRNLTEPVSIWAALRYIHENPVRRSLCDRPEEWLLSSAGAYTNQVFELPIKVDLCPYEQI